MLWVFIDELKQMEAIKFQIKHLFLSHKFQLRQFFYFSS